MWIIRLRFKPHAIDSVNLVEWWYVFETQWSSINLSLLLLFIVYYPPVPTTTPMYTTDEPGKLVFYMLNTICTCTTIYEWQYKTQVRSLYNHPQCRYNRPKLHLVHIPKTSSRYSTHMEALSLQGANFVTFLWVPCRNAITWLEKGDNPIHEPSCFFHMKYIMY